MNILLLEDDVDYQNTIKEYLESLKYSVDAFENGDDALDAIYEKTYQLLILDIRVPGTNGYDLVKTIKENEKNIPVIFVTSLTDINNVSMGYELGCNDYLKKPFSVKELKYRVEQVIKQCYFHSNENTILLNDDFSYDIIKQELYLNNEQISFTKKEKCVVFCLVSHIDQYISIESLREDVWDDKFIHEADIRVCIKNIRKKTSKDFITTQRGLGYKIAKKQ